MKYLIFSDSHHRNDFVKYLVNYYKGYDVIHLGDKQMDVNGINIRGNCDDTGLDELIIEIDNNRALLTHGNYYQVKYTLNYLVERAKELKCNIVLFEHTHKQIDMKIDNVRLINPGALMDGYYIIYDDKFNLKKLGE